MNLNPPTNNDTKQSELSVEDNEINHLVKQYSKDPQRFIPTIGGSMSLQEILLKHRTEAIAIYEGKSNGKDIEQSEKEAVTAINQLIISEGRKMAEYALDNDEKLGVYSVYSSLSQERQDDQKRIRNGLRDDVRTRLEKYIEGLEK